MITRRTTFKPADFDTPREQVHRLRSADRFRALEVYFAPWRSSRIVRELARDVLWERWRPYRNADGDIVTPALDGPDVWDLEWVLTDRVDQVRFALRDTAVGAGMMLLLAALGFVISPELTLALGVGIFATLVGTAVYGLVALRSQWLALLADIRDLHGPTYAAEPWRSLLFLFPWAPEPSDSVAKMRLHFPMGEDTRPQGPLPVTTRRATFKPAHIDRPIARKASRGRVDLRALLILFSPIAAPWVMRVSVARRFWSHWQPVDTGSGVEPPSVRDVEDALLLEEVVCLRTGTIILLWLWSSIHAVGVFALDANTPVGRVSLAANLAIVVGSLVLLRRATSTLADDIETQHARFRGSVSWHFPASMTSAAVSQD